MLTELRIMISCHDRGGRETLLTTAETILCSLEASALAVWTLPCPHPASTRPSLSLLSISWGDEASSVSRY